MKLPMINLYEKFVELNRNIRDSQKLINLSGVVKAYYGINREGFFRLAFLSRENPNIKGTTKNIDVVQGRVGDSNYWTCFDLKNDQLLSVFCIFGEDMVSCVVDEKDEYNALTKLRVRFNTWVALFRKTRTPLSPEKAKGLYGELFFLNEFMIPKYGYLKSIDGWSGPEMYSKDFSVDQKWYEIKTISVGGTTIKISSLQQLSSDVYGMLIVARVEEMADSFDGEKSTINKLCQIIISKIEDSETKDSFLRKLSEIGYDFSDDLGNKNYKVHSIDAYGVKEDFPVLRESDIRHDAINNVSYELILKLISDFKEELK